MNDYYSILYDIDFFSTDEYKNELGKSSISVNNPGKIEWNSWIDGNINGQEAKSIFESNIENFNQKKNLELLTEQKPEESYLITLLIAEYAYRNNNEKLFLNSFALLIKSPYQNIKLKAVKLSHAFYSLKMLVDNLKYNTEAQLNRIEKIQNHALSFLNQRFEQNYKQKDIKVEKSVKKEWLKHNMNFSDPKRLENFYKTTSSYVLELTAANHQVETLFNYSLVIKKLKELGITHLYDYAGGIGTFVLMAKLNGLSVAFSELDSITREYAIQRINDSGDDMDFHVIEYDSPDLEDNQGCIVCTEVLEHIYEPEKLVEYFYQKLKSNGILVVSESFDYVENFCTHLPKHKGKGGKNFINYMKKVGFDLIPLKYQTHPKVFRKR
ncbi:MAG: class I SAM-dependent methyltransferase [Bacteroidales bacterium]|nr:class I SAM-dependent methyltransferase [Bacteroidales bacterium]